MFSRVILPHPLSLFSGRPYCCSEDFGMTDSRFYPSRSVTSKSSKATE